MIDMPILSMVILRGILKQDAPDCKPGRTGRQRHESEKRDRRIAFAGKLFYI
jgi:hypothetical protein